MQFSPLRMIAEKRGGPSGEYLPEGLWLSAKVRGGDDYGIFGNTVNFP